MTVVAVNCSLPLLGSKPVGIDFAGRTKLPASRVGSGGDAILGEQGALTKFPRKGCCWRTMRTSPFT
jgi:hypothetical protein